MAGYDAGAAKRWADTGDPEEDRLMVAPRQAGAKTNRLQ